jgi:hypothetical protein
VTAHDWIMLVVVTGCAVFNVQGSYKLWRNGLHCPVCARQGRWVYALLLLIGSAMAAGYFRGGDWVTGAAAAVIVGTFFFDLAYINRYLDRQESL